MTGMSAHHSLSPNDYVQPSATGSGDTQTSSKLWAIPAGPHPFCRAIALGSQTVPATLSKRGLLLHLVPPQGLGAISSHDLHVCAPLCTHYLLTPWVPTVPPPHLCDRPALHHRHLSPLTRCVAHGTQRECSRNSDTTQHNAILCRAPQPGKAQ